MTERLAELESELRGDVLVARVLGEIDASNTDEVRLGIIELLTNAHVGCVLDLSEVGYIDSSGVKLLFDLASRLAARRQEIRLVVGEGAPMRRVLDLCGVGQVAPIEITVDAAVAALSDSAT